MKVLWFSNTPCNASEYFGTGLVGGGWLMSLDKNLQHKVDLHIAFYSNRRNKPFKYGGSTYYPISRGNWRFKALLGVFWKQVIDKQDLSKYLEIIEKVKPDVIHIHGTENAFGCIIPHISVPVVVSIQGCMTVYHHKFLTGFTKGDLRVSTFYRGKGPKQFVRNKSFGRSYREFEKLKEREQDNFKNTGFIIGRTSWDKRVTSVLAPKGKYFHADELLRDAFYLKAWMGSNSKRLVLHTTTSSSTYKGFETLCEALFILNSNTRLHITWQVAGLSADDSIVKVTKKKLKKKFPSTGLKFLGKLDENRLVSSMCNADVYVLPSHIENSPNSLCEAMILGMPCIATYAGGTPSLLENGIEGILVQDGDPWVMAGAIIELYSNPEVARQFGMRARERALKRHDHGHIVDTYIRIYSDIILIYKDLHVSGTSIIARGS